MVKIYISNDQSVFAISPRLKKTAREAARVAIEFLDFERDCEISLTFTDDEKIHKLNREYREKDRSTDVLSFPLVDWSSDEDEGIPDEMPLPLGDIVISLETAYRQAREYGHSLQREVAFLTVHSVLHLMGYDHETSEEDEKEMFALQDVIIGILEENLSC